MIPLSLQSRLFTLRSNKIFELFVVSIILLSALVIGAKTYSMPAGLISLIGFLDIGITIFFLIEISIRFAGDPQKSRFFFNGWNVFDSVIVIVSLIPIEDSELALVGRLIRIFRCWHCWDRKWNWHPRSNLIRKCKCNLVSIYCVASQFPNLKKQITNT